MSRISRLARFGSQSELECDVPQQHQGEISKSDLGSFRAQSPEVRLDDMFIREHRGHKQLLPSLISFEKRLERGGRGFEEREHDALIRGKQSKGGMRIEKGEIGTRPSMNINSAFEHYLNSDRKHKRPSKESLMGTDLGFKSIHGSGKKQLLGKRGSFFEEASKTESQILDLMSAKEFNALMEKEKLKIVTRKIVRSYKKKNRMAMKIFKKICIMEPTTPEPNPAKPHSNNPKSFIIKLDSKAQESLSESGRVPSIHREEEFEAPGTVSLDENVQAPPNSTQAPKKMSQGCREKRLWSDLFDKLQKKSKNKRRRRGGRKAQSEVYSFNRMERKSDEKSVVVDIKGKFEFLDLSFKNINKETNN
jgi:hypothetical protein